jgi:hypothetical protein
MAETNTLFFGVEILRSWDVDQAVIKSFYEMRRKANIWTFRILYFLWLQNLSAISQWVFLHLIW